MTDPTEAALVPEWLELPEALARLRLGMLSDGRYRQMVWAAQAEGHRGPAVTALAAEDWSGWHDARPLVEAFVSEVGGLPTVLDAVHLVARAEAARALAHGVPPRTAIDRIGYYETILLFEGEPGEHDRLDERVRACQHLADSYSMAADGDPHLAAIDAEALGLLDELARSA